MAWKNIAKNKKIYFSFVSLEVKGSFAWRQKKFQLAILWVVVASYIAAAFHN